MDRSVGPYQLGDSLGALPFGELVTATHSARSEPLAVLLLDDRLAKDQRFRGLLRLEVARAGGVRHPSIARVIEVGVHNDAPYIVVERPAEARTLARALADADAPSGEAAVALVRRLAEGLDAAHSRRIVHGALDPTCILVTPDGGAVAVGVALIGAVEEAGQVAVVAERTDTAYTAPEQQTGRRAVASADGYALGVLAGELLRAHASTAGSTAAVTTVLDRQRAADPAARFPSCTAFATALAEAMRPTAPAEATPVVIESAPPSPTPPPPPTTPPPLSTPVPTPTPAPRPVTTPTPTTVALLAAPTMPLPVAPVTSPEPPASPRPAPSAPRDQDSSGSPEPDIRRIALTPAMEELLKSPPHRDLLGDTIREVAERIPGVDDLLDRYAPDGKIGPVPLGLAVAGVLALLLLPFGQTWLAVSLLVIAGLLYGVPRLGNALTASERADPRALQVTGIARLRRTPDLIGQGSPELVLADGVSLGLHGVEYEALAQHGQPIVIQRPAQGASGVIDVVVGHDLPGTSVTYLAPNLVLLDVRAPDRTVLYRRAPYQGEPGDREWTPADGPLPGTEPRAFEPSAAPDAAAESVGAGPPGRSAPTTGQASPAAPFAPRLPGNVVVLPIPPAALARLKQAAQGERVQAGAFVVFALVGISLLWMMVGFLSLFFLIVMVPTGIIAGWRRYSRAFKFAGSRPPSSMVRIVGPVTVTRHRANKSIRDFIHLSNGTKMRIDHIAHGNIASAGEVRISGGGFFQLDASRHTMDGYLSSQHELLGATTTFEPSTGWLLEVRGESGATIFRQIPLRDGDLGPFEQPK